MKPALHGGKIHVIPVLAEPVRFLNLAQTMVGIPKGRAERVAPNCPVAGVHCDGPCQLQHRLLGHAIHAFQPKAFFAANRGCNRNATVTAVPHMRHTRGADDTGGLVLIRIKRPWSSNPFPKKSPSRLRCGFLPPKYALRLFGCPQLPQRPSLDEYMARRPPHTARR